MNGTNLAPDVATVQDLLNGVPHEKGGPNPKLVVDGKAWGPTVLAIKRFQKVACGFAAPDGRVDPGLITIKKLNELNGAPATNGNERYEGIGDEGIAMIKEDVKRAKEIALGCMSSLFPGVWIPHTIPTPVFEQHVVELLEDTFDVDGSNLSRVRNIQIKFQNFPATIDRMKFKYSDYNLKEKKLGKKAFILFTDGEPEQAIYVTESYFAPDGGKGNLPPVSPQMERALTLIHEYVHYYCKVEGHPPRDEDSYHFIRTRMGIPYQHAQWNPYCYEHYAKWLRRTERDNTHNFGRKRS